MPQGNLPGRCETTVHGAAKAACRGAQPIQQGEGRAGSAARAWVMRSMDWPVNSDRYPLSVSLWCRISLAWISMSAACPWAPPSGWWIMMRLLGRLYRLPCTQPRRQRAMRPLPQEAVGRCALAHVVKVPTCKHIKPSAPWLTVMPIQAC